MPKPRLIKPIAMILDEPIGKLSNIPDDEFSPSDYEEEQDTFDKFISSGQLPSHKPKK